MPIKSIFRKDREDTKAKITVAIKGKRAIEFYYHGGERTAEPFCLGATMTGGTDNESLLCYQTGGYSEYGEAEGWKLYRVSEMSDLAISKEDFRGDRPGYEPANPEMAVIYCCIAPDAERRMGPEVKPAPKIVETIPIKESGQPSPPLTHNERMRRFRFTHPRSLKELYQRIFARPSNPHRNAQNPKISH